MSPPPSEKSSSATPWATQWIEDARASLPEAPPQERPACSARLSVVLFACGQDEEAEAVLSAARREAARTDDRSGMARIEIALADGSAARDHDARAHGHLAAARHQLHPVPPSIAARAWIVEARLARAEGRPAPHWKGDDPDATQEELLDPSERIDLGAELSLERAIAARLSGDWTGARVQLERALELASSISSPRLIALAEIEIGLYAAEVDDPAGARARIHEGVLLLGEAGLKRDEGRAMIRLAQMMAAKGVESEGDSAPQWLVRAKAVLGERATWRDRSSIRSGVVHDLIDLIGTAPEDRERLGELLHALGEVNAATDPDELPPLLAHTAARILEADHVVVALRRDGELEPAGRWGEPPAESADLWKAAASAVIRERDASPSAPPISRRGEAQGAGPALVVPMGGGGPHVEGAIYADKLARSGQFREQDHAIAVLLAEFGESTLERLRTRAQERSASSRVAHALDALRDGVISWDPSGTILWTNPALEAMLRVPRGELVGARAGQVPALLPLWAAVSTTARLDGHVVKMPSGSFVVSTRPLAGNDEASAGVVVSLVELDRAQKIAQRIGAARPRYGFHDLVGMSPALLRAVTIARQATAMDSSVLITGESGTGKEVIAQAIHTSGARAAEPFIGLNVAALPGELLEAELFGYERGASTAARAEGSPGLLERAGGGTLLLDEIGEMPLAVQAKLLRVLQERVVGRLGGSVERPFHARVMATSRRDLAGLLELVERGKLRTDLLYRLRVMTIELPPLRERREDIAPLAQHYLLRFAEQQRKRAIELAPGVLEELARYDWPGNVRELANVLESEVSLLPPDASALTRLATRLTGRFRTASGAIKELRASAPTIEEFPPSEAGSFSPLAPILPLVELEKKAYLHALEKCNQNVARAAEALGVSKVTFYSKLRSWGMHPRDRFDDEGPTSVRRARVGSSPDHFEPPTRTSNTKMPTEK